VLEERVAASPVPVTLTADPGLELPRDIATVAWFVCAEGLTNVARHARASRAAVTVGARSGGLLVTIEDDGTGFGGVGPGSGLRNLRDRVEAAGGELRIGPGGDGGTVLAAELPLDGRHGPHAATSAGSREPR
jgi:signal transduction histidine kinase